ncbi:MAG: heme exporter protein CcmB [Pseudomonadales bacterium]|jgi:heme exporter protein B|nr:heme exporter protein CcmB [Pseudomonadales bacterium]MDP6471966.1 heme exporter protein CcmB [Pseudomonadales bacterium]MDP6826763.1 heme exporter protein CcmB [Pseudomonadales bacterium]MDP6971006.1 heme exporter protein CcmB [Pseudomonadales bacterium]
MFRAQLIREWRASVRSRDEILNPLVFLFLSIMLFALGLGGEAHALSRWSPGVLWALVLLTNLLSLEGLFRRDFDDGTLEQMVLLAEPAFVPVVAKILVQWCFSGALIALLTPVLGLVLNMPMTAWPVVMATLAIGTPALSMLGAIGAALTVGLRRGGVLLALLILPFYVPVLIFGVTAASDAMAGLGVNAQIFALAGISMLAVTAAPFAVVAAVRISLEQA